MSSGSIPTATATPPRSWTPPAGWSPRSRSRAARLATSSCCAWSPSGRRGRRCWALEGTGCYGAGLASFLADRGEWVVEIDRPKRTGRTQAKSDALDAIHAGREALSREQLACPRQRGHREALQVLQLIRAGAVKVAADARRHLKALLVTAPEPLRASLCRGTWLRQARACAALTAQPNDPVEYRATVRALRATAERALAAHQEATQLGKELGCWPGRWRRRCWPSRASARSPARKC
jgi:transposase